MSDEIVIKVEIDDKTYPISCKRGEEERVKKSALLLSETIKDLKQSTESVSENRLLVMSGLILADKVKNRNDNNHNALETKKLEELIKWLEKSTSKLNNVARLLDES
tara:strand:+ start:398 stop:718 length:321 start_codon:yes stop_codon:yes gene_type:complete